MIYSRCTNSDLQQFEQTFIPAEDITQHDLPDSHNVDVPNEEERKKDADLPFNEDACIGLLGKEAGKLFYMTQFQFCPVVLKKTERGRLKQKNPGPDWNQFNWLDLASDLKLKIERYILVENFL